MYATLIKGILAGQLRSEGKKQINKDTNSTGKDDATGRVYIAIADAVDAVDLSTASAQTVKNMANGLRAAADSLDKEVDQL